MAAPKLKVVNDEKFTEVPLPERIRVGPFFYKTRWVDELESMKTGYAGFCDDENLEIGIREDLPPQRKAEVMLHEVLHACFNVGNIRQQEDSHEEEAVVTSLTFQLLNVYRDNPQLMAWIHQNLSLV